MISIVVPVRDEPRISEFLFRLHEVLGDIPDDYEVLIITGDRETLHTPIPSLPHQKVYKSYGDSLERAILLGFSVARGERIVVLDADGSHPPEAIPEMLNLLDTYDLVVASRFLSDSQLEAPFLRRLISHFFIKVAHFLGSHLSDPMSGFFAVRKEIIDKIRFRPYSWKVCLEIELKSDAKVTEIPIRFQRRRAGVSKASLKVGLKLLWALLSERL